MSNSGNDGKIASEDDALNIIDSSFPRAHKGLRLGRGDDCAELAESSALAVSTDLFLEDVHFRRSYFSPEDIGHKALAVNLSDLASAGARPAGFSLGLMCPPGLERAWLGRLFKGMSALAARYDLPLTGGDISAAPMLGFSITVWGSSWFEPGFCLDFSGFSDPLAGVCGCGNCSPPEDALTRGLPGPFIRRGAEAGDLLFLLSPGKAEGEAYAMSLFDGFAPGRDEAAEESPCILGLAAAGLELLERRGVSARGDFPAACSALLRPQPMLAAGRALALPIRGRGARVRAMDLSDGLLRDLPRLLNGASRNRGDFPASGEGLGADLDFDLMSLHPELLRYAASAAGESVTGPVADLSPAAKHIAVNMALRGGDEYGLLCACPVHDFETVAEALNIFAPGTGIKILGWASGTPGLRWRGKALEGVLLGGGFDHFAGTTSEK